MYLLAHRGSIGGVPRFPLGRCKSSTGIPSTSTRGIACSLGSGPCSPGLRSRQHHMRKGIADPTPNAEGGNVSFCEDTMNEMYLFHRLFNETMSGSGDDPMSNKLRKICRQHTHTYNFTTGDMRK